MTRSPHIHMAIGAEELAALFAEIRLYLDAVETFRREGHEPSWRTEIAAEVLR